MISGYSGGSYGAKCGKMVTEGMELSAVGHQFGEWEVVNEASYTEYGKEQRIILFIY